jgi:hypothetical protein
LELSIASVSRGEAVKGGRKRGGRGKVREKQKRGMGERGKGRWKRDGEGYGERG